MNLRETLERWDDGMECELRGREVYLYAGAFVHGAHGERIAVTTDGPTIRLHDLEADTRSAVIHRKHLTTAARVVAALRAQLDALPYWEPESDNWGPDPWATGRSVRREDGGQDDA